MENLKVLNATKYLGTDLVKPHINGYLMHAKFYDKLKAKSEIFMLQDHKEKLMEKELENVTNKPRIQKQEKISDDIKINQKLVENLESKKQKLQKEGKTLDPTTLMKDDRFGDLFKKDKFKIDTAHPEYVRLHGSEGQNKNKIQEEEDEEFVAQYQAK